MENMELDPFVRRSEFLSVTGKLALAIAESQSDIRDIKERMATKDDIGRVLNAIDSFAHKDETYDRKDIVHDARINNHEERLTRLENPIIK